MSSGRLRGTRIGLLRIRAVGLQLGKETLSVSILAHSPVYGHDWLVIGCGVRNQCRETCPSVPVSPGMVRRVF